MANASTLILHCAPTTTATKKGNVINWTFHKRSESTEESIVLKTTNPNELRIANVSVEQHDGFYTCSFGSEYHQVSKANIHFSSIFLPIPSPVIHFANDVVFYNRSERDLTLGIECKFLSVSLLDF